MITHCTTENMMDYSMIIMTITALCISVESIPIAKNDRWYIPRLVSQSCDKKKCPAPRHQELYQTFCEYECLSGNHFVCLEDEEANVIEFCMSDNLECEAGFKMNASIDWENSSRIILQKLICPPGTYKQYKSYCFKECVEQESTNVLPQEFIVIEPGNFKEPIKVECDAQKGFYTTTNQTWFYYDRHLLLNYRLRNYCEKIIDNPCPVGQRPLDDGSCVCGVGSWSKDENRCVQNTELSVDMKQQSTIKPIQTSSSYGGKNETAHFTQWVIIAIVAATFIVLCVGIAIKYYCKRRHSYVKKDIANNNNTFKNVTFIDKNITYNLAQSPEETGLNVTDEDDVDQSDE